MCFAPISCLPPLCLSLESGPCLPILCLYIEYGPCLPILCLSFESCLIRSMLWRPSASHPFLWQAWSGCRSAGRCMHVMLALVAGAKRISRSSGTRSSGATRHRSLMAVYCWHKYSFNLKNAHCSFVCSFVSGAYGLSIHCFLVCLLFWG